MSSENKCEACGAETDHGAVNGDGWVALCPECAYAMGSPPELTSEEKAEKDAWLMLNVIDT